MAPPATSVRRATPLPAGERRAAIIRDVLPMLVERGLTVTTRELAAAAGVSEGTLFNVFADKEALIAAAVDAAIDPEPFERAIGDIDPSAPFADRLVAATELIQRRIVDVWRLVSQLGAHGHRDHRRGPLPDSPALIALLDAERDRLRRSPADAARLLRAMTLSLTHPLMTAEPSTSREIVDLFLHGVVAGRSES
jgi:AcrR family transcriptional regulator